MLHRSRPIGMSAGPIPLSEIECYVRLFEVRQVESFVMAIDALDRIYLQHVAEETRSKTKQPAVKSGQRTKRDGRGKS